MKKYSHIIILALSLVVCSCSYEYEMPDYSNAVTSYEKAQLEKGIENKIREEYSQNGIEAINIDIKEEHAIEKDANGNIIYDGEARGRVSIYSKSLDLSYTVKHRVKPTGGHYQDVVGYYQRSFNIDVSPFDVKAIVTNDMLTYIPHFYSVSRNNFVGVIIDKAHELGYELMDAVTYVTERDKEKKDLIRYEHDPLKGMVASQMNAEYLYVEIDILGRKKKKLGTFVFNEFKLSGFDRIELTTDLQYEFVEEPGLATFYFYNVKNSLPIISKANELGFEFASWNMFITEKVSDENVLTRFEHESIDGMIEAQEGAKSIDVEVEIFGWPKEDGRVNYNKKQKIGTFVIRDIMLSEINNTTLELTDDMQYEFVRHE